MNKPFISLIIPVYNEIERNNGEKRLRRCLDKVIEQNCADLEIICVDDCSTDKSLEVLTDYKNTYSNITVIHNEHNGGLGFSRNQGMRISKGEYIWFVDADDYIETASINKIREILKQDNLDVLCFDMKYIQEENETINPLLPILETGIDTGQELFCRIISTNRLRASVCGQIYKKQYLQEKKIKFTEGTICEDIFFSIRALIGAEKAKYIRQALYLYHRNSCSITTKTSNRDYFIGAFVAYCDIFEFWYSGKWTDILSDCISKFISQYYNIAKEHFNTDAKESIDVWMKNANRFIYKQYQLFLAKETGLYLKNVEKKRLEIVRQYNNCIVYGAGAVARELAEILNKMEQHIIAYAISENAGKNPQNIYGVPVVHINSLKEYKDSALVIIATLPGKYSVIENTLNELGFLHVLKLVS